MIEKSVPREPRLSDEEYDRGEGNYPYESPIPTKLRKHEGGSVPTPITESLYPKTDFNSWLNYDGTDTDSHDPDTGNQEHDMQSDTQSDGN